MCFFSFWLGPQKPSGGRPTNITLNIHNGVGLQQSNAAAAVVTGRVLWNLCARFNGLFCPAQRLIWPIIERVSLCDLPANFTTH